MDFDVEGQLRRVERSVSSPVREGRPARAITLSRSYATTVDDLWDAVTNGERLALTHTAHLSEHWDTYGPGAAHHRVLHGRIRRGWLTSLLVLRHAAQTWVDEGVQGHHATLATRRTPALCTGSMLIFTPSSRSGFQPLGRSSGAFQGVRIR